MNAQQCPRSSQSSCTGIHSRQNKSSTCSLGSQANTRSARFCSAIGTLSRQRRASLHFVYTWQCRDFSGLCFRRRVGCSERKQKAELWPPRSSASSCLLPITASSLWFSLCFNCKSFVSGHEAIITHPPPTWWYLVSRAQYWLTWRLFSQIISQYSRWNVMKVVKTAQGDLKIFSLRS